NIVYLGAIGSSPGGGDSLQKYDHRTKQVQLVTIWPEDETFGAEEMRYRFQWTYPIVFDPHDPDVLYATGNVVFRTTDGGQSWQAISPDLTHADPETLKPSGGPLTYDAAGAEIYATIFAFAACPHEKGVLWAGSDDGLVHVTRDGGQTWQNVTPPEMAKFTQVTMLEPSPFEVGTVYATAVRHKMGDYAPYIYKTSDYGQTWSRLDSDLPADDFCRVIRADPTRPGLLYLGTETRLYVSFDDGQHWQSFQANLPITPIYDLVIKENDLVVATHGRSFWILDDLTPLHHLRDEVLAAERILFPPRDTVRFPKPIFADLFASEAGKSYHVALGAPATYQQTKNERGEIERRFFDAGEDVPRGVQFFYYFKEKPEAEVTLTIATADGEEIDQFTSVKAEKEADQKFPLILAEAGMNRFLWDMTYRDGAKVTSQPKIYNAPGPLLPPGDYTAVLTVGDWSQTVAFQLLPDPRVTGVSAED
ncbi:MAG: hypothetical protein KDD89_14720, partial [Anaerolineales bacterium]|nr:hypothetical protein [Anaerolineales bacterium]